MKVVILYKGFEILSAVRILKYLGWHESGGSSASPDLPFSLSDLISLQVQRKQDLFSLLFLEVIFFFSSTGSCIDLKKPANSDLCHHRIFLPAGICKQ